MYFTVIKKGKKMKLPVFKNQEIRQNSLNCLDVLGKWKVWPHWVCVLWDQDPPTPLGHGVGHALREAELSSWLQPPSSRLHSFLTTAWPPHGHLKTMFFNLYFGKDPVLFLLISNSLWSDSPKIV